MISDAPQNSTKNRLLDAAEQIYANGGSENLSIREIAKRASVNLASVNYHFGSKSALICYMAARRLDPINEQRLFSLSTAEGVLHRRLSCETLLKLLVKGMITSPFDITSSEVHSQFAIRIKSDIALPIRVFLSQRYRHVEERYLMAFARCAPHLEIEELAWRVRLFAFGLIGTGVNVSILRMIKVGVCEQSRDKEEVVRELARALAAALAVPPRKKG